MSVAITPVEPNPSTTSNGARKGPSPLPEELTAAFVALGRLLQSQYPEQYADAIALLTPLQQSEQPEDPLLKYAGTWDNPEGRLLIRAITEERQKANVEG